MRYTIHKSDDGRYFIQDEQNGLPILWVGKKSIANTACKHFNKEHEKNVSKSH